MMVMLRSLLLLACLLVVACGDDDAAVDGTDASVDAGNVDAGPGPPMVDAGMGDAGAAIDAGPPVDDSIFFEDYFLFGATVELRSTITDVLVLDETTLVELMYSDDARAGVEV